MEENNTLLNTDLVNNSLSSSQHTTQNPEGNEVIIEIAEESDAEPPAEPRTEQSEQCQFTHLHELLGRSHFLWTRFWLYRER